MLLRQLAKRRAAITTLFLAAALVAKEHAFALAPNESIVTLPARPGVSQTVLLLNQEDPVASVILYSGGNGYVNIYPNGSMDRESNFIVRTRQLFFAQGFNVAVVDAPSDHRYPGERGGINYDGFR